MEEKKKPTKVQGCMGCLVILIVAFFLIIGVTKLFSSSPEEDFAKTTGVTTEQAKDAIALLKEAGVQYDGPVNDENKEQHTFYIMDKTYGKTVFNVVDGKLITAWGPQAIKYIANGKVRYQLADVSLTTSEVVEFKTIAEGAVKKQLKAPSTADFNDVVVAKQKGVITAFGKVDAQNSFGAKIRNGFIVTIDPGSKAVKGVLIQ